MTDETHDDDGDDLVGIHDIAKILGRYRQIVDVWTKRKDFPEPVTSIITGGRERLLWRWEDVEAWLTTNVVTRPQWKKGQSGRSTKKTQT